MSAIAVLTNIAAGAESLAKLFPKGSEPEATVSRTSQPIITAASRTAAVTGGDIWQRIPSVPGVPDIFQRPVKMTLVVGLGLIATVAVVKRIL